MSPCRKVVLVVATVAAVVSACSDDPTGPGLGEEFLLAPGQRVLLPETGVRVRFLRVAGDSRCPRQAQCVWAGDAQVVLEVAPGDGDAAEYTLHTNEGSGPRSLVLGRRELALLRLEPWPEMPGGVAGEDYRAVLVLYERLEATASSGRAGSESGSAHGSAAGTGRRPGVARGSAGGIPG